MNCKSKKDRYGRKRRRSQRVQPNHSLVPYKSMLWCVHADTKLIVKSLQINYNYKWLFSHTDSARFNSYRNWLFTFGASLIPCQFHLFFEVEGRKRRKRWIDDIDLTTIWHVQDSTENQLSFFSPLNWFF